MPLLVPSRKLSSAREGVGARQEHDVHSSDLWAQFLQPHGMSGEYGKAYGTVTGQGDTKSVNMEWMISALDLTTLFGEEFQQESRIEVQGFKL